MAPTTITLTDFEKSQLYKAIKGIESRGVLLDAGLVDGLRAIVDRFDLETITPNDYIDPVWDTGGLRG